MSKLSSRAPITRDVEELEVTVLPEKEIIWPSCAYNETGIAVSKSFRHFPSDDNITLKNKHENIYILDEFKDAVSHARKYLYILDRSFDEIGYQSIKQMIAVTKVSEIRILTGSRGFGHKKIKEKEKELDDLRNEDNRRPDETGLVFWKSTLDKHTFPYLHDRFAIVDNELWHFGGTVGGGMRSLSAVSRGWCANKTDAIKFFEIIWNY